LLLWARNLGVTRARCEGTLSSWSSQLPARHSSGRFLCMPSLRRRRTFHVTHYRLQQCP
jgi:hypothetical protein